MSLVLLALVLLIVLGYVNKWEWVGVGETTRPKTPEEDLRRMKTLWDWLQIVVVPATIAVGVYWLNTKQSQRQRAEEERRRDREQQLEHQRIEEEQEMESARRQREQELENQRVQDAALQAYLDQMGSLLLTHDLRNAPLEAAHGPTTLARAYTLTTLERVGPAHKRSVMRFLFEAGLLTPTQDGGKASTVSLSDADLSYADLADMHLASINLEGANLRHADLSNIHLTVLVGDGSGLVSAGIVQMNPTRTGGVSGMRPAGWKSNLMSTDLRGANLRQANIPFCDLHYAKLRGADLRGADLREVFLIQQQIEEAIGDQKTLLPQYIKRPEAWSLTYEEQVERLQENGSEAT